MRSDAGQGTVEWVGLVAAIATLVFAGAAIAQAPFVGHTVTRQLARALCIVKGGDCRRDQQPCTVTSATKGSGLTISVAFIEVGGSRTAVVERRSDGTALVTVIDGNSAAVRAAAGIGADVALGGRTIAVGGSVAASVAASALGGRSWLLRSPAEVDALLRNVSAHRPRMGGRGARPRRIRQLEPLPEPDVRYDEVQTVFAGSVGVDVGEGGSDGTPLSLGAGLTTKNTSGARVDRRTGERTVYLKGFRDYDGEVSVFGEAARGSHRSGADEQYALIFDAAGRPVTLEISATSATLPAVAQPFGGMLRGSGKRAPNAYEVTANLDLTDPANRAAAEAMLSATRNKRTGPLPDAVRALRDRVLDHGTIEVRGLSSTDDGDTYGASASVPGVKLGAKLDRERQSSQLVTAASRGIDGEWLPRDDCAARPFADGAPLQSPGQG